MLQPDEVIGPSLPAEREGASAAIARFVQGVDEAVRDSRVTLPRAPERGANGWALPEVPEEDRSEEGDGPPLMPEMEGPRRYPEIGPMSARPAEESRGVDVAALDALMSSPVELSGSADQALTLTAGAMLLALVERRSAQGAQGPFTPASLPKRRRREWH
jgi:hypothetical protein